jgi:hypothetical protein
MPIYSAYFSVFATPTQRVNRGKDYLVGRNVENDRSCRTFRRKAVLLRIQIHLNASAPWLLILDVLHAKSAYHIGYGFESAATHQIELLGSPNW